MCKLQIEPLAAAPANSDAPGVYLSRLGAEINLSTRKTDRASRNIRESSL